MSTPQIPIIDKILNVIDSDDIQILSLAIEANLPKEKIDELKKMLKRLLHENKLNSDETYIIKQFLHFI